MEQQTNRGGKRKGAGRKPVLSKKKQVSLYVEGKKIIKFGDEEKLKEKVYGFIDGYGKGEILESEIKYTAPTSDTYDCEKLDKITHDEPNQWQEPNPQVVYKTAAQWVQEKRELESEEEFNKWEQKLDADTLLTDKQKKIIKIS